MDRCLGNLNLVERAIDAFVDQFPSELDQLDKAIKHQQTSDIRAIAHRMKGGASNVAATGIASLLSQLESPTVYESPEEATEAYQQLQAEWKRLIETIE